MTARKRVVRAMMTAGMLMAFHSVGVAAPQPVTGEDISAPGPKGLLKGTLTRAGKNAPVVLILPGSGPTDRDGNNVLGIKAGTYRLLAEGLAAQGIASVRVDKRGLGASAAAVTNGNDVTIADYVQDTRNWIASTQKQTGAHCVWLLGHSEGGLIALVTAAETPAGLCGVILASTPGKPLGDVVKQQLAPTPFAADANRVVDQLAAGKKVDVSALTAPLQHIFNPAVQGFLISAFSYNPAQLMARIKLPVLIIQGAWDAQVSVQDAGLLKAAKPDAQILIVPQTGHLLKTLGTNTPDANRAVAADPNLPLAAGIVADVSGFIKKAASEKE